MMSRRPSFATRLAIGHAMIARGAAPAHVHLADQLDAAATEVRAAHDRLAVLAPLLAPDRAWHQRIDTSPSETVRAYLLATVLDCTTVCPHLRRGGPQPAIIRLPLRRADCARCVQTLRRPPPDEADRCDVCTTRGVTTFHPFAVRMGPALVVGDACSDCADVLGIVQEVAS